VNAKKLILLLFFLSFGNCYAVKVKITADYKHYDKYRDAQICKGNVIVQGDNFRIESPYVIRYFKDDKIIAMDRFTFEKEGYKIAGTNMEYYFNKETGNADKIRINFGETFLGGRYMTMDQDKFHIYDAYYSACNLPSSHYHFSGQQITLYPDTGLIVSYYATCWIWVAPVIPVPTFVYSAPVPRSKFIKRTAKKSKEPEKTHSTTGVKIKEEIHTQQPVPEIGGNIVDGTFIKQGFNWYFTPKTYLKTKIGYAEKTHFNGSISGNYLLNNMSEGEFRVGSNDIESSYYGWTHYIALGEKLITKDDEKELIYEFYKPGGKYSYELELLYSKRERPNREENFGPYTRVSMTPKATLRSNRKPLPFLGEPFTYYFEASTATVSEEVPEPESPFPTGYSVSSQMDNYYADIMYASDWGWLGKFNAGVDTSSSKYRTTDNGLLSLGGLFKDDSNEWNRAQQKIGLHQEFFDHIILGYENFHYITQSGASPYMFEGYWFSPYDTFSGSIKYKAWWSYLLMKANYNLPSWDLNYVRYQLMFGMHCYDLIFEYVLKNDIDKYRGEFNFSFDLVPSRWE
jgi:hypothetical protein